MSPAASVNMKDQFHGREDIAMMAEKMVFSLFGPKKTTISPKEHAKLRSLGVAEFVAYVLYRTALPDTYVYHALHLLNRLSMDYAVDPSSSYSPGSVDDSKMSEYEAALHRQKALFYHRLLLSAIILSTKYHMDDCYSNRSWVIAAKNIFSIEEINLMEFSLFASLGWTLRRDGEDLTQVVGFYEGVLDRWREDGW